jgi:RNA polymerase sigma-70 factor, ECF subfamily
MTAIGDLVKAARDPDGSLESRHVAFTCLVEQSQHMVLSLALTRLRDVEDARDVAQESFAVAWRRIAQLRDPVAFPAWLNAIVARHCLRRLRRRPQAPEGTVQPLAVEADMRRLDYQAAVAATLELLTQAERDVVVAYYFLGQSMSDIARLLHLKPGTVGKRLHTARIRIRCALPRFVRGEFMRLVPSQNFVERVRRGLLDDYLGEFRFERRPDHAVHIIREGDSLIADSGDQRHVLVSLANESLVARHYDGEAHFGRSRHGDVTHFVYYEFGRRLGVARKVRRTLP